MSGRRRVENDVIISGGDVLIRQVVDESVEARDFYRTGAGKGLLGRRQHFGRQQSTNRPEDGLTIPLGLRLRIDLDCVETGGSRYEIGQRRSVRSDFATEHLSDVRSRVGRHQQYAPSAGGRAGGQRAGHGGLSDAALAGEEREFRSEFRKGRQRHPPLQQQPDSPDGEEEFA